MVMPTRHDTAAKEALRSAVNHGMGQVDALAYAVEVIKARGCDADTARRICSKVWWEHFAIGDAV
jgi:hypothetical protein